MSLLATPRDWLSFTLAATILLGLLTSTAWTGRTAWLVAGSWSELRALPSTPAVGRIQELARSVGVPRLRFLPPPCHAVFCAGALRPVVYVSQGVCDRLNDAELAAVLTHELEHAASFDPLRRAAWRAASDVFFFMPVLAWLRLRRIEASELRADRRAIDRFGPRPVASALWSLGSADLAVAAAAFSGTAELRTAQLLGDRVPRQFPSGSVVAVSLAGLALGIAVAGCAAQVVVHLH